MWWFRLVVLVLLLGLIAVIVRGCQCEAMGGAYTRSGTAYRCVGGQT